MNYTNDTGNDMSQNKTDAIVKEVSELNRRVDELEYVVLRAVEKLAYSLLVAQGVSKDAAGRVSKVVGNKEYEMK